MPRKYCLLTAVLIASTFVIAGRSVAAGRQPAPMSAGLIRAMSLPTVHAWVYFKDKGLTSSLERDRALARFENALTARALWRRSKTMHDGLVDELDLPVSDGYVARVLATGAQRRAVTRWFNAMSVQATPSQLTRIAQLDCVARLDLVEAHAKNDPVPEESIGPSAEAGTLAERQEAARISTDQHAAAYAAIDSTQYGVAWKQLKQIQVPLLHQAGFHGEGILICMLDDGFRLTHEAFNYPGHALKVAHSRDFINGDTVVANQAGQDVSSQDQHGTWTTSCIGGYYPTHYLGAAYEARFILGKTEYVPHETNVEEDYWLMGTEWADSLGADVISSSLAYRWFMIPPADTDTNFVTSYHFWNLDGHTAITTRAASIATSRGIVCVNAAGNDGGNSGAYPDPLNKMDAPADGESVLAAGAVDSNSVRVSFSSIGPTYDRRIKPDIMARGYQAWMVNTSTTNAYNRVSGTSFSCPLTAGAVALILQMNPSLTPIQLLNAVHATGDRSLNPDTLYGYGLLHAYDAAILGASAGVPFGPPRIQAGISLSQNRPNPFRGTTTLNYEIGGAAPREASLRVYDLQGRQVAVLVQGRLTPGAYRATWNGRLQSGAEAGTGIYFCRLESAGQSVARRIALVR